MYLSRHAVTPQFREELGKTLPGLGNNKSYWRMISYLLFNAGQKGKPILIPQALVALVEHKRLTGKYSAIKFLDAFRRDVVDFDLGSHTLTQCRSISRVHWHEALRALLEIEIRATGCERVMMVSGAQYQARDAKKERDDLRDEAILQLQALGQHPAQALLDLINNSAPNRYTAIKRHIPEARALLDSGTLALAKPDVQRQHNILTRIDQQAMPIYGPAPRSARIYALNDSLTSLQRDIREIIVQDWIGCDLKAAQLCIIAKDWNVPAVAQFLESGESVWLSLCKWMNESAVTCKPKMKDALYAFAFGAGDNKMLELLGDKRSYDRFKAHSLIKSLYVARRRHLTQIRKNKGAPDAFGRFVPMGYKNVVRRGKTFCFDTSRNVMALCAQSYELLLLMPVVEMAVAHKDDDHGFSLCMWLHDGFCFVPHRDAEAQAWKDRLCASVKAQADNLGIITELE